MTKKIKNLQKESIAAATGALRLTAQAALDAEIGVEQVEHRLTKLIYNTVDRIRCSPVYNKIL